MEKSLGNLVDDLGKLKAKIAALKASEDALKAELRDRATRTAIEGRFYRATITRGQVTRVDYKAILAKLEPSPQLLSAHTRKAEQVTIRVVARTGRTVAA